jgi:hypothetical protein
MPEPSGHRSGEPVSGSLACSGPLEGPGMIAKGHSLRSGDILPASSGRPFRRAAPGGRVSTNDGFPG